MKLIKTKPRYRCDFCHYTATKSRMEKHEVVCWQNPDRYCPTCKNKGYVIEFSDGDEFMQTPCPFCSQFDPAIKTGRQKRAEQIAEDMM